MKLRVAAVLLLLLTVISSAFAEPRYVLIDLGPTDSRGRGIPGRAINNHRQIACALGFNAPVYLWEKGSYTNTGIRIARSSRGARCIGINDACQIAGVTPTDYPCIWQNGMISELGTGCNTPRGAATGINNSGQVTGWTTFPIRSVFLWEQGNMREIAPLEWIGKSSLGYAISENGIITGQVGPTTFVMSDSGYYTLDEQDGKFSEPSGINDDGVVVGQADFGSQLNSFFTAFMAKDGTLTELAALEYGCQSKANSINNAGIIVGASFVSYTPGLPAKRAVLWENGVIHDLNDLIVPGSGLVLTEAWDINDRGDIVGEAIISGVGPRGFLLTPWIINVTIDIHPGIQPNIININTNQPVPVAVMSSEDFDTNTIDYATVCLAGVPIHRRQISDINRDGRRDVIFWFKSRDLDLCSNDTTAKLTGKTKQGRPFEGVDEVVVQGGDERPTPLQPRYTYTELGLLPETVWSIPYGINNVGQVVGECSGKPCLWDNGSVTSLEYPGAKYSTAYDINDSGQVTLVTHLGAFMWSNGSFTRMNVPGGKPWMPFAVNNNGAAAGWGYYTTEELWTRYAYFWQNGQGCILYPPNGGATSFAQDINDSGLVAGYFDAPDESNKFWTTHPCVWLNGTAMELPLPVSFNEGQATAVNNRGEVAGACRQNSGSYIERACIWRNNIPYLLTTMAPNAVDRVVGINDWGQVVGDSHVWTQTQSWRASVVWHAGKPFDLGNLTTGLPEGWEIREVTDINNNGQIIGSAWGSEITDRAFILNPIPAQITVDIHPGDAKNMINTRSRGLVPVALYSSPSFTTASLLPETVTLAGATPQSWKTVPDMNGDGRNDMIFTFRSDHLNIDNTAIQATLIARTFDGWWVEGCDTVKVQSTGAK